MRITKNQWDNAVKHVLYMIQEAKLIPFGQFYVICCEELLNRYDKDVKQFERCEACIAASGQDGSEWE